MIYLKWETPILGEGILHNVAYAGAKNNWASRLNSIQSESGITVARPFTIWCDNQGGINHFVNNSIYKMNIMKQVTLNFNFFKRG